MIVLVFSCRSETCYSCSYACKKSNMDYKYLASGRSQLCFLSNGFLSVFFLFWKKLVFQKNIRHSCKTVKLAVHHFILYCWRTLFTCALLFTLLKSHYRIRLRHMVASTGTFLADNTPSLSVSVLKYAFSVWY